MDPEIESISDKSLQRLSLASAAALRRACESLNLDAQLEAAAWKLLESVDQGEALSQMRDDSPDRAKELFALAITAMVNSRRMLECEYEMIRRGLIKSPI